jgi:HD superfamily phosphohydrolase
MLDQNYLHIYNEETPDLIRELIRSRSMRRIGRVDMNCGMNYTCCELFDGIDAYPRLTHSIGTALIVYHFTKDETMTCAALFHDIAAPVFSHVIDFMHGDYASQESTEEMTAKIIASDPDIVRILKAHHIAIEDTFDYHRYPVADNDSPKLSADRLEYTIGNMLNYGFAGKKEAEDIYRDLTVGKNEEGEEELMFAHVPQAELFTRYMLKCSEVYVSDSDRYGMQLLSEIVQKRMEQEDLAEKDLYTEEPLFIERYLSTDPEWERYRRLCGTVVCKKDDPEARIIDAKKRWINAMVKGRGRIMDLSPDLSRAVRAFTSKSFAYPVKGIYKGE